MTIRSPPPEELREDTFEVEELSPDAIIPDSVTMYMDPVVDEVADGGDYRGPTQEEELNEKFTEIDLDRMRDDTACEESEENEKKSGKSARKSLRSRKRQSSIDESTEPRKKHMKHITGTTTQNR
jgi:hypothetical protein